MKHRSILPVVLAVLASLFATDVPSSALPPPPGIGGPRRGPVGVRVDRRAVRGTLRVAPRRVAPVPGVRRPVPLAGRRVLPPRVVVAPRVPLPYAPVVRVYHPERNVVTVETKSGETEELPYVAVPVLFVVGTADFIDAESYKAVEDMAGVIKEILKESPEATFEVEGHTSTDGSAESNLELSARRAKRVYDELTLRYGIDAAVLSAQGYGESYAAYPGGSEAQMQLDRRVLLVRTK